MSVKSSASFGDAAGSCGGGGGGAAGGEVVRVGYLKKLKTMRKKFFVLRAETPDSSSRLEYYDNDKKYRSGQPPKRCISLTACFNINKRVDTKHKHVIALYTKDDCFCVVLDAEKELDEWLKALLSLQHGEDVVDGEPPKPTFEHVWQVTMLNKGLGNSRNIIGPYHLCFTDKTLSLVRKSTTGLGAIVNSGHHTDQVEFSLMSIRRCGHSECFFYMEVGRSAITGAGELWMQTEDTNIAQNMGEIILRAMSNNNNKEDLGPKPRIRSSSANEASKPILMQRRQTHCGQKSTSYCSPSQDGVSSSKNVDPPETTSSSTVSVSTVGYSNISTPFSSTQHPSPSTTVNQAHLHQRSSGAVRPSQRRHSVSAGGPVSWSGMAHHQRTQSLPLAPHVPHIENNNPCYLPRTSSKRLNNNSSSSIRCMGGRERCDSMPSRARTSSEGTAPHRSHLAPHRPQSFYGRDISHSPPAGSPVSPASAACSTDSAGSSLSIDEPDAWPDYADTPLSRYGHSLTPDEPIVEEESSDSPYVQHSPTNGSPITGGYVPMAPLSSDDGYVDMSPGGHNADMSPAASSCSITSGTPSTDMRFSEYHLEKVTSYFTPSEEDDTSSAERPHRAYSVGSRPDVLKLRTKLDNHDNARVRAFSVGSRSKGVHNRVLPPHGHPPSTGGKSSSAPLLSGSHSQLGSHNSMERMDDLMEMDFSKPSSNNSSMSGYVAMSPKNRVVPPGYVEMKPGFTEATTPDLPYMDMRPSPSPVRPSHHETHIRASSMSSQHEQPIRASSHHEAPTRASSMNSHHEGASLMNSHHEPSTRASSMNSHHEPKDSYVDMRPATSPLKPSLTSSKDYMDMKPSTSPHKPKHPNPYYVEMTGKLGTSPKNATKTSSPIQEEYMDMDFQNRSNRTISQPVDLPPPKKPAEGYMEMLWGGIQRKTSIDATKNPNDDYMNMSSSKKTGRRGSKKEKQRSQPIAIQTPQPTKLVSSQSPVNSFATFLQNTTRKNSSGTPPKHPPNYLPLSSHYSPNSSPYSSLRRQRSRKNSRRDSRDSKDITPTSESSTIFPFSPGSPIKPFQQSSRSPDSSMRSGDSSMRSVDSSMRSEDPYKRSVGSSSRNVGSSNINVDSSTRIVDPYNSSTRSGDSSMRCVDSSMRTEDSYKRNVDSYKRNVDSSNRNVDSSNRNVDSLARTDSYNSSTRSVDSSMRTQDSLMRSNSSMRAQDLSMRSLDSLMRTQDSAMKSQDSPMKYKDSSTRSQDSSMRTQDSSTRKCAVDASSGTVRIADSDYVNFCPGEADQNYGDYAVMRGGGITEQLSNLSLFKPIVEDTRLGAVSPRPGDTAPHLRNEHESSSTADYELLKSRPSSVSSEFGSSSASTVIGGSRPASVNAERPASVSSERELHYASLDLAPTEDDGTRSPHNIRGQEGPKSPTPTSNCNVDGAATTTFTYAEIDFIKSLKNNKIKH